MSDTDDLRKYLPLSESTTYILLALAEPRHGYAVMQWVAQASQDTVEVGPGRSTARSRIWRRKG